MSLHWIIFIAVVIASVAVIGFIFIMESRDQRKDRL